ncbi:MAG: MFS transporter [Fusobacteriaceae bacterium]
MILKKLNYLSFGLTFSLFLPLEIIYFKELNFSVIEITILNLSMPIFIGLCEIPTGILADHLFRIKVMKISCFCFVVSMLVLYFFNSFHFILLSYLIEGIGWAFASGNNEAILHEESNKHGVNFNISISKFYEYSMLGLLLSSVVVILLQFFSAKNIKIFILITLISRILFFIFSLRINVQHNEKKIIKKLSPIEHIKRISDFRYKEFNIGIFDGVSRVQFFLPLVYQLVLINNNVSKKYIVFLNMISLAVMFFSQRITPKIVEKFSQNKILYVSALLQSISVLLIITKNTLLISLAVLCVYFLITIKNTISATIKHGMCTDENIATFLSAISLISLVTGSAYFYFIGYILNKKIYLGILLFGISFFILNLLTIFYINVLSKEKKLTV